MSRLDEVQGRISAAAASAGRTSDEVILLAVSKKQPMARVRALIEAGQRRFGENYVDEAVARIDELADPRLEWHFIGPIQSNKTRGIAEHFDWVHSVDRLKIVRRLDEQRPAGRSPLNVLIQVNLDGEAQKAGCEPGEIGALAAAIADCPNLVLRGLMAIPAPRTDPAEQAEVFGRLHALYRELARHHETVDTLSAGMSGDLEAAVAAGSTMVRVGTDLFGPRPD